jgi:hypothetical protein
MSLEILMQYVRVFFSSALALLSTSAVAQTDITFSAGSASFASDTTFSVTQPQQLLKSPFALKVVNTAGNPVAGLSVTFVVNEPGCFDGVTCNLPPITLYGTFSDSVNTVLTDSNGIARSGDYVGGSFSGSYQIAASFNQETSTADAAFLGPGFTPVTAFFTINQQMESTTIAIQPAISGSWYDPATSGQGLNLEVIPDEFSLDLLIYFYTFDPNGQTTFLVAEGGIFGNSVLADAYTTSGGFFPPAFDPAKIHRDEWGRFSLTFTDCNTALFAWLPSAAAVAQGYTSGSTQINRITSIAGQTCSN